MNTHIISIIFIAIVIALLVFNILSIFTKATIAIISSILDKSFKVKFTSEVYTASICVLIISIYFLL